MLKINDLVVHYGNICALKKISLNINKGEIVALIGANGAGKTTLLKTISGLLKSTNGTIIYEDEDITKLSPTKIASIGIAHVPEGRHVFPELTIEENLYMGAFSRNKKKEIKKDVDNFYKNFPILKKRKNQYANCLSGGEQQMLAIARALMSHPDLLLLDEPSMGLAPIIVEKIFKIITTINKKGTSILLVEQNAKIALSISSRAYVLETGNIALSGTSLELIKDDNIKKVYLGISS